MRKVEYPFGTYPSGGWRCYIPVWWLEVLHTRLVVGSVTYPSGGRKCYIPVWWLEVLHTRLVVGSVTYLSGGWKCYIPVWWLEVLHTCLVVGSVTYPSIHVYQQTGYVCKQNPWADLNCLDDNY